MRVLSLRLSALAAVLGLVLVSACVSARKDPARFRQVDEVSFHDAKGSQLSEIALDVDRGLLVGQVSASGGQAPAHPFIEARFLNAAGESIATSHGRLKTLPGSRVVERRRTATFEVPVPSSGFDRVELAIVATHPEH
jgi:hypothetical protein